MEKYSVLMSIYYKEKPEWLKISIDSMLKQTIFPSEFVIVEDGQIPEELENVISNYETQYPNLFKIIRLKENMGLGNALSIGIQQCSFDYVARMDSDDYSYPTRIEEQCKVFKEHLEISLVGTNVNEFMDEINNVISYVELPEKQEDILKFSKRRCPFRHPSILYKKSKVLEVGNYHSVYLYEDYDSYIRMLKSGCQCYNIQKPLVCMRIGKDFYRRRGGISYLKTTLKFKNQQLKNGYFSFSDYIKSTIPHVIVCLIPNRIREFIYKKLLRKKLKEDTKDA